MRDPLFTSPIQEALASATALMYVNLILGGVLLLEALALFRLLPRRRDSRWEALVPLALAVFAFALAYRMWDVYAHSARGAHFPPFIFALIGGTNSAWQPTIAIFVLTAFILLYVLALRVSILSGDEPS